MQSKLIGKIADITDKVSIYYNEWGIITMYDGDLYHIAMWCNNMESAKEHESMVFRRNEFKVRRIK